MGTYTYIKANKYIFCLRVPKRAKIDLDKIMLVGLIMKHSDEEIGINKFKEINIFYDKYRKHEHYIYGNLSVNKTFTTVDIDDDELDELISVMKYSYNYKDNLFD
jgi:hypothetical protein